MKYLGIDYGDKHVGVAMADGPLADPIGTYDTNAAVAKIATLIETYNIDEIIIGDCPGEFLRKISDLGLPVNQADETLSSHDARESLMHTSQKKRRDNEHQVSAAVILQNWLDASPKKV